MGRWDDGTLGRLHTLPQKSRLIVLKIAPYRHLKFGEVKNTLYFCIVLEEEVIRHDDKSTYIRSAPNYRYNPESLKVESLHNKSVL